MDCFEHHVALARVAPHAAGKCRRAPQTL